MGAYDNIFSGKSTFMMELMVRIKWLYVLTSQIVEKTNQEGDVVCLEEINHNDI